MHEMKIRPEHVERGFEAVRRKQTLGSKAPKGQTYGKG